VSAPRPQIRLSTVGLLLVFLTPAIGLSHALEDLRFSLWALGVVVLACAWRRRPGGNLLLDLVAAGTTLLLTWYMWRETALPTAALATSILVLQSYKLLFPRLQRARELEPPLAQTLYPRGSEGEARVVEASSLVLLGAASASSFRPSFAPLFLLGGACLVALRVGRTRERMRELLAPAQASGRAAVPQRARLRVGAAALTVGALVGGLMLFATPRLGTRYLPRHLQTQERMSGFSDQVGLDDIGRLQQSTAPAFHVEVPAGSSLSRELYWRGAALDRYDGVRWSHSEAGRLHARLRGRGGGLFEARRLWGKDRPGVRRVVLYLEPLGTRMLFTTGAVRSMRFRGLSPDSVWRTELATLYTKRAYSAALCYELEYYPGEVPLFLDNTPLFQLARRRCLELPAEVDRQRLRSYAVEVVRRAGLDPEQATPHEIASALELHLANDFTYSLEGQRTPGTEPVADFLFTRKTGHCEVFASAHAVLLRCMEIPARVVTGYRSRTEEGASTHTVRQSDAHAWVEAHTAQRWQRYEPTPGTSWGSDIQVSLREQIELLWFKWIVAYDAREQSGLVASIGRFVVRLMHQLAEILERPLSSSLLIFGALGLAGGLIARRVRRRSPGPSAFVPGDVLRPLLRALARRGQVRAPGETLGAFAGRVAIPEVRAAVSAYYGARFGSDAAQPTVEQAVSAAVVALGRQE